MSEDTMSKGKEFQSQKKKKKEYYILVADSIPCVVRLVAQTQLEVISAESLQFTLLLWNL